MTKHTIALGVKGGAGIRDSVEKLPGVVTCTATKENLSVVYWPDQISLRDLVTFIQDQGYEDAQYVRD